MSSAQNAGLMQRTYAWLFAAADNLNDAVIGVEQETTLDSFSPNQPNILVDAHSWIYCELITRCYNTIQVYINVTVLARGILIGGKSLDDEVPSLGFCEDYLHN